MGLEKPVTTGRGKTVRLKRRKQKRLPRRILESVAADWQRWDEAADFEGLNWSEWARRALNARTEALEKRRETKVK